MAVNAPSSLFNTLFPKQTTPALPADSEPLTFTPTVKKLDIFQSFKVSKPQLSKTIQPAPSTTTSTTDTNKQPSPPVSGSEDSADEPLPTEELPLEILTPDLPIQKVKLTVNPPPSTTTATSATTKTRNNKNRKRREFDWQTELKQLKKYRAWLATLTFPRELEQSEKQQTDKPQPTEPQPPCVSEQLKALENNLKEHVNKKIQELCQQQNKQQSRLVAQPPSVTVTQVRHTVSKRQQKSVNIANHNNKSIFDCFAPTTIDDLHQPQTPKITEIN